MRFLPGKTTIPAGHTSHQFNTGGLHGRSCSFLESSLADAR